MRRANFTLILGAAIIAMSSYRLEAQRGADSRPMPTSVVEAEAEGAAFPPEAAPPSLPYGFRPGAVTGTAERKCVAFPGQAVLSHTNGWDNSRRSGEFVVGGEIIEGLKAGVGAKVFWVPLHDPSSREAILHVRSMRLDQPAITARFSSSDYASSLKAESVSGETRYVRDGDSIFYPTGFSLPDAGRWLVVATSASDWGCFIVTVR